MRRPHEAKLGGGRREGANGAINDRAAPLGCVRGWRIEESDGLLRRKGTTLTISKGKARRGNYYWRVGW